jgi:hypothetical protein
VVPGGLESRLQLTSLDKGMQTERRRAVRKRLNQLAYIRIGADNGGLVADLGEGGLGFQTIAAIEREGPLRFWFTLDTSDRVQAVGELVWTDESRKVGGLRFTQISEQALKVIQDWMGRCDGDGVDGEAESVAAAPKPVAIEPPAPPVIPVAPVASIPPPRATPRDPLRFSNPPRRANPAAAPAANPARVDAAAALAQQKPLPTPAPRPEPLRVMATPQIWSSPVLSEPPKGIVSPEMVRGFTTSLTVLALVLTVVALGFGYRREIGRSLVNLGERLAGESPLADVAPSPDPIDETTAEAAPNDPIPSNTSGAAAAATNANPASPIPAKPTSATEFKPLPPPSSSSAAAKPVPTASQGAGGAQPVTAQPKPPLSAQQIQPVPASQSPAAANTPTTPVASNRPASTAGFQNLSAANGATGDNGQLELETAQQFLDGGSGQRKAPEAAKWLWMSVEKGNPKAEVLLADLFQRGDGVVRNCAQARVLLGAAIKHGDTEAIPKLHALDRGGCR